MRGDRASPDAARVADIAEYGERPCSIAGCGDVVEGLTASPEMMMIEQRHKWRWARHSPFMTIGAGS